MGWVSGRREKREGGGNEREGARGKRKRARGAREEGSEGAGREEG